MCELLEVSVVAHATASTNVTQLTTWSADAHTMQRSCEYSMPTNSLLRSRVEVNRLIALKETPLMGFRAWVYQFCTNIVPTTSAMGK